MKSKILIYSSIIIFTLSFTACRHTHKDKGETRSRENIEIPTTTREIVPSGKNSVVKMRKVDGVYHIPCKINGTEMEFIFDTGASDITMSLTEALFLHKQGKLADEDVIGTEQYQIADGSISEGAVVILRKVEIGDWQLTNVRASIVNNMEAPLLLGQSALAAFGKISIDYNRNEITFFK